MWFFLFIFVKTYTMKKILFLLLLSVACYGQTSTGQETEFDYGIKNNAAQEITTPTYLTTTGVDGTQGKIPSAYIEKTANKDNGTLTTSTTTYPTSGAVKTAVDLKQDIITNPITGVFEAGRIPYSNSSSNLTDSSRLLWDNTNSQLEVNGNNFSIKLKENTNNTWFTIGNKSFASSDLLIKSNSGKNMLLLNNPSGAQEPKLGIGNISSIPTESQLYVYGGVNGANIDARGSATADEANIDLEGNDWETSPNSLGFSYFGSEYSFGGTVLGYAKPKMGQVRFNEASTAIISSFKSGGVTPIRFGINNVEISNINDNGISYQSDFSGVNSANDRWLTDKGYVDTGLSTKQNTLTNPVTGTGTNGHISFWNGGSSQTGDSGLFWDNTNKRMGIGTASPVSTTHISKSPTANTSYGTLSLGGGVFGGGAGTFVGSASGTSLAVNEATGYTGYLLDLQLNGSSKFYVRSSGVAVLPSTLYTSAYGAVGGGSITFEIYGGTHKTGAVGSTAVSLVGGNLQNQTTGGTQTMASIAPIYNQTSGSSANIDLLINRTETAIGSGLQRLISAGTGGGAYIEKFGVSNTGIINSAALTASLPVFTDASKNLVSGTVTGTGAVALATSPALSGTPTAPTASPGTNTTQIATTAFVLANGGTTETASNGLTKTGNDIKLGGALTENTTITGTLKSLNINGSTPDFNTPLMTISSTGGANTLNVTSDYTAIIGEGTSGYGVSAKGTTTVPLNSERNSAGTSNIDNLAVLNRLTTGTAANGIGLSLDMNIETSTGSAQNATKLISKWTDATNATRTSQFSITGINNAAESTIFTAQGNGVIEAPELSIAEIDAGATKTLTTKEWVQTQRPYKVYTALLTQTGTDAPTATVLENTLGGTVVWTRTSTGSYRATLTGSFTANKTFVNITAGNDTALGTDVRAGREAVDYVTVRTNIYTGGVGDLGGTNTSIEIRVYN